MNTVSTHFQPFAAHPRASFARPGARPATAVSEAGPTPVSSRPATTVADFGRRSSQVGGLESTFRRFAAGFRSIVSNAPRPEADTPDCADTQVAPDRAAETPDVVRADTQVAPDRAAETPDVVRADTQVAPDRAAETPDVTRADTQVAPDRVHGKSETAGAFGLRRASQVASDRPAETPRFVRADTQVAPDRVHGKSETARTFGLRRASQVASDRPAETPEVTRADTQVAPDEGDLISVPDFTRADTRPVRTYTAGGAPRTTAGPEPRVFDRVA